MLQNSANEITTLHSRAAKDFFNPFCINMYCISVRKVIIMNKFSNNSVTTHSFTRTWTSTDMNEYVKVSWLGCWEICFNRYPVLRILKLTEISDKNSDAQLFKLKLYIFGSIQLFILQLERVMFGRIKIIKNLTIDGARQRWRIDIHYLMHWI